MDHLMSLVRDVRFALRGFRLAPAAAFVTALTIAIGSGRTTTVLSVANTLLFKPPAGVRETGRSVSVHATEEDGSGFHSFSWLDWRDLNESKQYTEDIAAFSEFPASLIFGDEPVLRVGMAVSCELFPYPADPARARSLLHPRRRQRTQRSPGRRALWSEWQNRFAVTRPIIGKAIQVNGHPFTVIGVAEPEFRGHTGLLEVSHSSSRSP
jgi:hypothetical protein